MNPISTSLLISACGVAMSMGNPLFTDLVAYYPYESNLNDLAPGEGLEDASAVGSPSVTGTGPAFSGNPVFNSNTGPATTNRSTLLVGNALNLAHNSGEYFRSPLGTAQLGQNFSIATWMFIAPDADFTGNQRYFVFEAADNYDISYGTGNLLASAANQGYISYVGSGAAVGTDSLAVNVWHHVVHTFETEGADTRIRVYVNGAQTRTDTVATSAIEFSGINIGSARDDTTGARIFDGLIDETAVWKRTLSATEVSDLRALGAAGTPLANSTRLAITASNPSAGTVSGSGNHAPGVQVEVSAIPALGYVFDGWSGAFEGQAASFAYTVTSTSVAATGIFAMDDADDDDDGLTNHDESVVYSSDPIDPDTDGDQIPDGAEVHITGTSPTADDSSLVDLIDTHFGAGHAGAITLSPLNLHRDPETGDVRIQFTFMGSSNQSSFTPIPSSEPAVSITPDLEGWTISMPAPANSVSSFFLLGRQP